MPALPRRPSPLKPLEHALLAPAAQPKSPEGDFSYIGGPKHAQHAEAMSSSTGRESGCSEGIRHAQHAEATGSFTDKLDQDPDAKPLGYFGASPERGIRARPVEDAEPQETGSAVLLMNDGQVGYFTNQHHPTPTATGWGLEHRGNAEPASVALCSFEACQTSFLS